MAEFTFNGFIKAFEKDDAKNRKVYSLVVRKVGFDGLKGLVMASPVDTGRARGNWQVTAGSPATESLERFDKGGDETITIEGAKLDQIIDEDPLVVFFITNNLPYIERLEDGYSKKAPAGMLGITFERLQKIFE